MIKYPIFWYHCRPNKGKRIFEFNMVLVSVITFLSSSIFHKCILTATKIFTYSNNFVLRFFNSVALNIVLFPCHFLVQLSHSLVSLWNISIFSSCSLSLNCSTSYWFFPFFAVSLMEKTKFSACCIEYS